MPETELRSTRLREAGNRAQELGKLTEHPAWQTLKEDVDRKQALYMDRLARQLTSGGPAAEPLNQREIDYWRGWFACGKELLDAPERATAQLNKLVERTHDRH